MSKASSLCNLSVSLSVCLSLSLSLLGIRAYAVILLSFGVGIRAYTVILVQSVCVSVCLFLSLSVLGIRAYAVILKLCNRVLSWALVPQHTFLLV